MIIKDITWTDIIDRLRLFEETLSSHSIVYGVPTGGMILAGFLSPGIKITYNPLLATVILDDIFDSGKTQKQYLEKYSTEFICLYHKTEFGQETWVRFPWEKDHPGAEAGASVENNIVRILQYIGEEPTRQGLVDTPKRVVKSYKELFGGYNQDPKDLFTVFEQQYDQMVVLKDIELYSLCEHHMLPFYGKAHVAYIPNGGKVIGISKLARLVDLYARRLQIQERIGDQVTSALMEHLQPLGAACVIEASHMCMKMRGVQKQNSIMTTSSLTGVFKDDLAVRTEFLNFIS